MAWRIVQQPNGLYARFSDVVDNFTDCNMTIEEATELCIGEYRMSPDEAKRKVLRAVEAGLSRWYEALKQVSAVHGKAELETCFIFGSYPFFEDRSTEPPADSEGGANDVHD